MDVVVRDGIRASGLLIYRMRPIIEFLLLQTSYGEHHWTPPKGHVDPGEDIMTAAIRETEEEAGLQKSHYKIDTNFTMELEYPVKGRKKFVTYWLAEFCCDDSVIRLSDEHQAYRWCDLEKAEELANFQDMRLLLNEASKFIKRKHGITTADH